MVVDGRLTELSGLVAEGDALWAVNDGGRRAEAHRIDPATCKVVDTRTSSVNPFDVEDLAQGPDGSLWVGDLGDNERSRDTVAVVVLPALGEARLHRLTYPDGPHDAEALLVDRDGRPIVVTKEIGSPAGIYRTAQSPSGDGPTPLVRVGEVTLPASDTVGGPLGGLGARVVTGAAAGADGQVVALRSYTDAWLYRVPDGDLAAALTGIPARVPLPGEPQGEAIALRRDGTLVSGSEARGGAEGEIRIVAGAAQRAPGVESGQAPDTPVPATSDGAAPPYPAAVPADGAAAAWSPALVGAGALAGLLLVAAVALAARGARR